jgi:hypothetical protein
MVHTPNQPVSRLATKRLAIGLQSSMNSHEERLRGAGSRPYGTTRQPALRYRLQRMIRGGGLARAGANRKGLELRRAA